MDAMAFIPVINVASVELIYDLHDQKVENTFYVFNDNGWQVVELVDVVSFFTSWWTTNIMPLLSDACTFEKVIARDLTTQFDIGVEVPVLPPVQGSVGGGGLPGGTALAIKRTTGLIGRSSRGRIYLPGIPKSVQTGNAVSTSWLTQVLSKLNQLNDDLLIFNPQLVLVHVSRFANGAPRTQGEHWAVQSWSSDGFLDSQRRRNHGVGT